MAIDTSKQNIPPVLKKLEGGLIVSCQASRGEPLNSPEHILALSMSAINGGAIGLRLAGADNIGYVRQRTNLPIVGLSKSPAVSHDKRLSTVYITSTFAEAKLLAEAGSDIIAFDATARPRPDDLTCAQLIERIHKELGKACWADASTLADGLAAAEAGADVVSTTLSGYTEETRGEASGPDFKMLEELCKQVKVPVILEGRVWNPEEVRRAFELGAFAVVVGSAITRPQLITERFVRATRAKKTN